jgi:multidrug efflux pump subunit AcrB
VKGLPAFFADRPVAANMIMWIILAGGLLTIPIIEQEVFPDVESGIITASVEVRGATPGEVEEGVCIKIEEAVQGLDGIERVTSRAVGNLGSVSIEVRDGEDVREVLDDVKAAVDAIDTFPEQAEEPLVAEFELGRQVVNVAVSGPDDEAVLRVLAEQVRDEILTLDGITRATLSAARPYEIAIEVSEKALRRFGLSFDEVAAAVRSRSLDLGGGTVKTDVGEILLRARNQAYTGRDFEALVLRTHTDGTRVLLGEVAEVIDGFEDTGQSARFDGKPTVMVRVFRVGEQRALDIAQTVKDWVPAAERRMPDGVELTIWQDEARILRSRLDLLVRNGRAGLVLVFLTLALFLRLSLALWVAVGIPISFLGALWVMPAMGVSINLISLFGFIVALGIVVDDAIVVGENVYRHAEMGEGGGRAVRRGVGEVAVPVVFAILTTVAAFSPLVGIPGLMGKFMSQLPLVVVPVLAFSMIESLLILPAHLRHVRAGVNEGVRRARWSPLAWWEAVQGRFSGAMSAFIERVYKPSLELAMRWRWLTASIGVATLLVTFSLVGARHVRFVFFPEVEADNVLAWVTMPQGTPAEVTAEAVAKIEAAAWELAAELEAERGEEIVQHVLASVGEMPFRDDQSRGWGNTTAFAGSHLGEVNLELLPGEDRLTGSLEVLALWRDRVGSLVDTVELVFSSNLITTGKPVDVQLAGPDVEALREMAAAVRAELDTYAGVYDIADSFRAARQELRLALTPEGEAAGLTLADLARQVRQGFYGEEAQRVQRGRDEVRVMVRYPDAERRSVGDLTAMRVRLPDGRELPFEAVATATPAQGDAVIERADRLRAIHVTAEVDTAQVEPSAVLADLEERVLPPLLAAHPGSSYSLEGQQREQAETMEGLARGFLLALVIIYALLAVPFHSYTQPLIVMTAIPFGIVGAIWGHMLMGMALTVMSMFGIVALTGVLVNDSLVMVDFVNRERRTGLSMLEAVRRAGPARFRAILLTSLTTAAGLTPLLLERSMQARFLIPMAVSLAFGVMFATFITLILVPVGCMILEDVRELLGIEDEVPEGDAQDSDAVASGPAPVSAASA